MIFIRRVGYSIIHRWLGEVKMGGILLSRCSSGAGLVVALNENHNGRFFELTSVKIGTPA